MRATDDHHDAKYREAKDKIADLDNQIAVASSDINMFRLKLISTTRDALASALHNSSKKLFRLNPSEYYMDGNYGCLEGFKCEYYKKPSGGKKEIKYKTLLYSVLDAAHVSGRDLYVEIRSHTVPAPPDFNHDALLESYRAEVVQAEADEVERKRLADERAVEQQARKAKSKQILKDREDARNAVTDPDILRELDSEDAAHVKYMRSLVEGERPAGDTSEESDNSGDEIHINNDIRSDLDIEKQTEPQQSFDLNFDNLNVSSVVAKEVSAKARPQKMSKKINKLAKKTSNHVGEESEGSKSVGSNHNHNSIKHSKQSGAVRSQSPRTMKPKRAQSLSSDQEEDEDANSGEYYSSTDSELSNAAAKSVVRSSAHRKSQPLPKKNKKFGRSSFLRTSTSESPSSSPSMLGQLHVSVIDNLQKRRSASVHNIAADPRHTVEIDPSFPDLDGHPADNSLLHEIDESLVRPNYSDNDAEFEDEDHRNDAHGDRKRSRSPSDVLRTETKKRSKRAADPAKLLHKRELEAAAEEKKEEKKRDAKERRDESIFQRRVLELNNSQKSTIIAVDGETSENQSSGRKRRVTSGISGSYEAFYGVNLAINQAQLTDSDIIMGCTDIVLGTESASSSSSSSFSGSSSDQSRDTDYEVVTSYRKKSSEVCDRVLKQKLMKHLQIEIFKEITFERLIVEYAVAKRASVGVADDEIIDIDWFEVMNGFTVNLKQR